MAGMAINTVYGVNLIQNFFLARVISLMVALGPIRSTAIDGLSEKLPFDQIYGQFFLPLEAPCLAVIDDCIAPCAPHWDSAIGDSFDSFDISIGEISDQDGYCCRVNRNFYFIYVPV